ncbi:hypothetical protein AV274_3056 [Blastocystis sp. ATCC 50177/Nand II]|uniref:Uncharacterized protein n=1 Tax=Blastocystis sp. subtype 1 (strain ATCC 50177 / NandII) TaxID=478820 RepID=A0A196SGJ8_BLAHN|nr:hypothetical protein AV274_3056 [Blastocystis sp. ATCC 50177/Nand II]
MQPEELNQPYAYSIRTRGQRMSCVITNPLMNSLNSVEAIVDSMNIISNLPPPYEMTYVREDVEADPIIDEWELLVQYPPQPSFAPTDYDISVFQMITNDKVRSMRCSSKETLFNSLHSSFGSSIIANSTLDDKEMEICRNKLKRLEYERLRMQSTTSPTEEENSFSYDMTSNMPSAEPLDVKCINDCLSSHFHDLLNPRSLSSPEGFIPFAAEGGGSTLRHGLSRHDSFLDSSSDEEEDLFAPFAAALHSETQSATTNVYPLAKEPAALKNAVRGMNPAASVQEEQLYERAKEHDRKHPSALPRMIRLSGDDSGVSLPHRHRASSTSTTLGTDTLSRESSASLSQEPILDVHTGFYRVLQDVVEVCGVERSNEIRRRGREYNNKLSQVRAARRALAEKATGEGVIWKNAEDLVSGLSHVVYDRDGNFGLYHSMLSMRMSYNPRVRSFSFETMGLTEPNVFAQQEPASSSSSLQCSEHLPPLPPRNESMPPQAVPTSPASDGAAVTPSPRLIETPRLRPHARLVLGNRVNTHEVTIPKELNMAILNTAARSEEPARVSLPESVRSEGRTSNAGVVGEGRPSNAGVVGEGRPSNAGVVGEGRTSNAGVVGEGRTSNAGVVGEGRTSNAGVVGEGRTSTTPTVNEGRTSTTPTVNEGRTSTTPAVSEGRSTNTPTVNEGRTPTAENATLTRASSARDSAGGRTPEVPVLRRTPLSGRSNGSDAPALAVSRTAQESLRPIASAKSEPVQTAPAASPVTPPPIRRTETLTSEVRAEAPSVEKPRFTAPVSTVSGERRARMVVRQMSNDEINRDFLPMECSSSEESDDAAEEPALEMDNDMTLLPQRRDSAGTGMPAATPTNVPSAPMNMLSASSAFSRSIQNLTSTPSEASHEGEKKRGAPNGSESDQTRISFVVQDLEGKRGSILPNADMPIDVDSDLDSEISDFFDGIS